MSPLAGLLCRIHQTLGVGTVFTADDQDKIDLRREDGDGFLAVGGGVADVFFGRGFDVGKAGFEGVDDALGFKNAELGLGYVGEFGFIFYFDSRDIFGGFDDEDILRGLADSADGFVVVGVADEKDGVALLGKAENFEVDFGDQRAGGVDFGEVALSGLAADVGGDAVGGVDDDGAGWGFGDFIDEGDAALLKVFHDVAVVDDFVEEVYSGACKS